MEADNLTGLITNEWDGSSHSSEEQTRTRRTSARPPKSWKKIQPWIGRVRASWRRTSARKIRSSVIRLASIRILDIWPPPAPGSGLKRVSRTQRVLKIRVRKESRSVPISTYFAWMKFVRLEWSPCSPSTTKIWVWIPLTAALYNRAIPGLFSFIFGLFPSKIIILQQITTWLRLQFLFH